MVHHDAGEFAYNLSRSASKSYYQNNFSEGQFIRQNGSLYVLYGAAQAQIGYAYDSIHYDVAGEFWETTSDPDGRLFKKASSEVAFFQPGTANATVLMALRGNV